jgi:tripartite-type tricarboxylate transporter receptor subunit TctC
MRMRAPLNFLATALVAMLPAGPAAAAQDAYPDRPVRLVVPSAAAGGTDIVGRIIAQRLSVQLGQQFVIDNRPGAGQMIGIAQVAKAAPDGYTLLMAASPLVLNQLMYARVPYDAVRDFTAVSQVAVLPNVLVVHPSLPARTLAEFLALARRQPGKLNYASAGIGTSPHMSMELLKTMAGIDLAHVPYKGTAPALADVLAGQVLVTMASAPSALPHIRAGKLRPLGVTSRVRSLVLPEVPTIAEAGVPGYEAIQWYGLLAPAGTPREIVARLSGEVSRALRVADTRATLLADGAEPVGSSAEEFTGFINTEIVKWTKVAKSAGIVPE